MVDLVVRGGTVVDGSGGPAAVADVAVDGGRVVEVGPGLGPARRTIDAEGRIVCPGFVDLHTHYDVQAFWDPALSPSPLHGITTVVGGNCGFSVAPLAEGGADYLLHMLARVEGMPVASLEDACDWDWGSFGDYLGRLDGSLAVNAGFLVGHSPIRRAVMGAEACEREATAGEIEEMIALLGRSLAEGGLGFSSSLAATHNDGDGGPVPSRLASHDELVALCEEVGRHEGTTLEFIPGVDAFGDAEAVLMGRMSAAADRPLNWNVLIVMAGLEELAREQLAASDTAAGLGGRVLGLTMPAPVAPRLSFDSGFLLETIPGWHDAMNAPHAEKLALLASPQRRAQLLEAAAGQAEGGRVLSGLADFGQYVLSDLASDRFARFEGHTVREVAAELGSDPFEVACEIAVAEDLRCGFNFPPAGDGRADWEARLEVWRDDRAVIGASDAGAHLDFLATFNYTTAMLRRAVLDLGLLDWPEAVSLLTDRPARLYGLRDRGRLAAGWWADVCVIDPETLASDPVSPRHDLPGDQWRLYAGATGYEHVLVNGVAVVESGRLTGQRPGTVLRSGRDTETVHARG